MTKFLSEPCRYRALSSKEENQIRKIFHGLWEVMKYQLDIDINAINKWCYTTVQEIKSYADQQIRILKFDYDYQRSLFNEKREECLQQAKQYHETREENLFNELCNLCKSLSFKVAQLKNVVIQTERPKIEPREKYLKENNDKQAFSSFNTPIPSDSNQRSQGLSASSPLTSTDTITTNNNNNNDNSDIMNTNDYDPNIKCPICFMIFPSNMTPNDRHQHVNEHIVDDYDARV